MVKTLSPLVYNARGLGKTGAEYMLLDAIQPYEISRDRAFGSPFTKGPSFPHFPLPRHVIDGRHL
jgi:hypothetical protein